MTRKGKGCFFSSPYESTIAICIICLFFLIPSEANNILAFIYDVCVFSICFLTIFFKNKIGRKQIFLSAKIRCLSRMKLEKDEKR